LPSLRTAAHIPGPETCLPDAPLLLASLNWVVEFIVRPREQRRYAT